ncbi:urease accessory protein [Catenulispora acidiphila DSM 44928]|uniref:Urease accessory protein UreD n=1 Tax=Catenulispora acidiphila (strain DSM 44928 / JCM 14897 / NBRC 102108 / NRRL B-24433 / ID139908) TaxID=479433 RepID=C7PWL6_CATAD|nr:urease accessory protein UreD [Catenulispora acidiphila]ACU75296.1 urease accessory protein [Catenulispora acidiphila DSM 44928]
MKATARLVAEARSDGTTRLATLAGQAPLLLRQTMGDGTTDAAQVHLVAGAAGPIGGDELHLGVHLGPGARVRIRSVAASLALPATQPCESTLDIRIRIESGAALDWSAQPLIAARGARHRTTVSIEMTDDAHLIWQEQTLLGRHGEEPGSVVTRLRVRRGGRPLLDHTLAVGPAHPGSLGPAVVGADRAGSTTVIVDPAWTRVPPAKRLTIEPRDDDHGALAVFPLGGPAAVISALAPDALSLQRLLSRNAALRLPALAAYPAQAVAGSG